MSLGRLIDKEALTLFCPSGRASFPTKRVYYKLEKTGYRSRSEPLQSHFFSAVAKQIFEEIAPFITNLLANRE